MRIVAISDLHGFLPEIVPAGDVLIIAGDVVIDNFSGFGAWNRQQQAQWMRNEFAEWLLKRKHKAIIGIAGNHDYVLEGKIANELPWTYLNDESTEVDGILFHGSPWTPEFCGWAFMKYEHELQEHWNLIPESTDVLVTHGPPYGILDETYGYEGDPPKNTGSSTLRWTIDNKLSNLKLHLFGHIHPARGQKIVNGITFANVTHVDNRYKPIYHPMVFDI